MRLDRRRRTWVRLVEAAACLGSASALASCGGSSSSSSPTTTAPVTVQRTVGALQGSHLGICQTSTGGEAPGIRLQATSRLELDCGRHHRAISVFAFDDPDVAFAIAGGGVATGDDVWLLGNLTVAGVALTGSETATFDRTMRDLGAHRYQGA